MSIRNRILPMSFLLLLASGGTAWSQSGGSYTVRKSTIDGGGGSSTGGTLQLRGSIGQADAAMPQSAGGPYAVQGGFWQRGPVGPTPPDLFSDGFEDQATTTGGSPN